MAADDLDSLRAAIDEIDRAIVEQLGRRRAAVDALARHKRTSGLPPTDPAREEQLRLTWESEARARDLPSDVALAVLEAVLASSRRRVADVIADEAPPIPCDGRRRGD